MHHGKEAGVAKVLACDEVAARSANHAGMGIVIGPRHILTCAHVVSSACGQPIDLGAPPDRPIRVVFPFAENDVVYEGRVVAWHSMDAKPVADVAVLELLADVPATVGMAAFLGNDHSLDGDPLTVFGYRAGGESGLYVEARFMGPTGTGRVQIDGVKFTGVFVENGYSGAAVWDVAKQAVVGMVSAKYANVVDRMAFMIPVPSLQLAWPHLTLKEPAELEAAQRLSASPNRLFQLPAHLSDFVAREHEVTELVNRLRGNGGRVGLSALKGMGGVGKTTLAVQVAHLVKDHYPDAQLFVDLLGVAERPVTATEAMARLIRDFHPDTAKLPETEAELLPIYRSTLTGKRALIVLDNAADESQVKNLISGDKTGFIITSRRALALDGVILVELDVLSPEKSRQLLRGILRSKGSDDELHAVAELCGHLPLALRVAGDFLRLKRGWTVTQYIDALNQERHRWLKIGTDPQKDVEAVLKLSSAQLVRDDVDLATRWHFLADWPADFGADAAAAAWDMESDEHAVREDLAKLVDRSLLLFDEKSSRYRLHDLMKPIAAGLFA